MDRYRLGSVRDVRALDERTKRSELAAAVTHARATADDVAAAAGRVETIRSRITAARAAGFATAGEHVRSDRFLARLRRDLDGAIAEHVRAETTHAGRLADIDLARARLTRARADREVIERHFATWRETQRKLADRRAD